MALSSEGKVETDTLQREVRNAIFNKFWYNKNVQKYLIERYNLFQNYGRIKWEIPKARVRRLNRLYKQNPAYRETANIDMTGEIIDYFHTRKLQGKNVITETNGYPRSGKSWFNLFLASIVDSNFSIDRVFYTKADTLIGEGMLNGIKIAKRGQSVLLDEQTKQSGAGQIRVENQFQNLIEVVGKLMINFHFCSPTKRGNGVCEFNFETLYLSEVPEGWSKVVVLDGDHQPLGRMIGPDPTIILGEQFMKQYEAKKDTFITATLSTDAYSNQDEAAIKVVFNESFSPEMKMPAIKALVHIVLPEMKGIREVTDLVSYIYSVVHMDGKGMMYFKKLKEKAVVTKQDKGI